MGGYRGGKNTTDGFHDLDVRWLRRKGMLDSPSSRTITWTRGGEVTGSIRLRAQAGQVLLEYRSRGRDEQWEQFSYAIDVEWTPCNYGGMRPWLICPGRNCGRRVAVLYGGRIFACRHCYQLVYESQHEPAYFRALRKQQKICKRLGGEPGEGIPAKPKGMHWRTYDALRRKAERAEMSSFPPWLLRSLFQEQS